MAASPPALDALEASARRLPELMRRVARADASLPETAGLTEGAVLTLGVGLSGGPARLLAARAAEQGLSARHLPLSALTGRGLAPPTGATAVLFSQGMSPNARLASALGAETRRRVVFTGIDPGAPDARGASLRAFLGARGEVVPVPSDEAHPLMVRVQAPALSAWAGLRWLARACPDAAWVRALEATPEAWARAFARGRAAAEDAAVRAGLSAPTVLVCAGRDPAELHHLAGKWAEALFVGPPLVVDALELAHGPLQAFFSEPRLVLGLVDPGTEALFHRVEAVLEPRRHRFVPLSAELPGPLSLFEHDAALSAWILRALALDPARLELRPAKGRDAPLYDLES